MKDLSKYKINFLRFLILLIPVITSAQLNSFILTVTAVDESCSGNGSLSFTTSQTLPGANVLFNIFELPDVTTPVAITAANTLGGLSAGTYRVIAIQSLGQESSAQQQDITIDNTYAPLTFHIAEAGCAGNASITITTDTGVAAYYEILSGPITFATQESPVFDGLPNGNYQIRVFDVCGEAIVQSYTLARPVAGIDIGPAIVSDGALPSCANINVRNSVTPLPNASILYPLTLEYTVYPPSGNPIVIVQTIPSGSGTGSAVALETLPFYHNQLYSYDLKITDACGNVFQRNDNQIHRQIHVFLSYTLQNCMRGLSITPSRHVTPYTVNFISAPAGFDPTVYNVMHSGPFSGPATYTNPLTPLPAGLYEVEITDSCGRTATNQIVFNPIVPVYPVDFTYSPACGNAPGSISGQSSNGALQTVLLISAPDSYQYELPHDVSELIVGNQFLMDSVAPGIYTFQTVDICNNSVMVIVTATQDISGTSSVEVTEKCNSFELFVSHSANSGWIYEFYLQRFDPSTEQWVHPSTGIVANTIPTSVNSLLLSANALIVNLTYFGDFRVLKKQIASGNITEECVQEIHSFTYDGNPAIDEVYSFVCATQSFDVFVNASGVEPLLYRITSQNGLPFVIQNGTSNIFQNLAPAIYNFQVEDACGNIVNHVYDVTQSFTFPITATQICDGSTGSLSVPFFDFLIYEWWKDDNVSNVLSTTATLSFDPFDFATDSGMYHVRITSSGGLTTCIDFIVDYEIIAASETPNAGWDNSMILCGAADTQNLFDLIQGSYDLGGIWTDISTNELIEDGLWEPTGAFSTFVFQYTVNGTCGAIDYATITITTTAVPETPVAYIENPVCDTQDISLFATGAAQNQYEWTGPNGFTSTDQNPVITNASQLNNGTYNVKVVANGCESETTSVVVEVFKNPAFTVQAQCDDGAYVLHAISTLSEFAPDTTFEWTGPQNFLAYGDSVAITGLPAGSYTVSVGSPNGCITIADFPVAGTVCQIPQGVSANNDGYNDTFDLSGMNVNYLKIFNRYGMVVFECENYTNEWHGQDFDRNDLPSATYYYYVRLDTGVEKTGWVYLIRE